jgi:hypothetical protein
MKTLFLAAVSVAFVSCAASSPRIDPAHITALHKGQTTVSEVVSRFGRPSVISRNPDGTQSATYLYGSDGQPVTTMVSLITSSPADSTTFYFDVKGVLTDYKINEAERAPRVPGAGAVPAAALKPGSTSASAVKTAPAKPASAQAPVKPPLPPNVTDRWPGSTIENR